MAYEYRPSASAIQIGDLLTVLRCTVKQRKIRFEDDATHDPEAEEKDTRVKYKARGGSLTLLQSKMLQLAGQPSPEPTDDSQPSHPEDDR